MGCHCSSVTQNNVQKNKETIVPKKEINPSISENGKRVYFTGNIQSIVNNLKSTFAEIDGNTNLKLKIEKGMNSIFLSENIIFFENSGRINQVKKLEKVKKSQNFFEKQTYFLNNCEEITIKKIEEELDALTKISHNNIQKIYSFFIDKHYYHIFTETNFGTSLQEVFSSKKIFSEEETGELIFKLVSALSELHSKNIVHRDIKLEHIKYSNRNTYVCEPKFSNFCFDSNHVAKYLKSNHSSFASLYFSSPETILGETSSKSDIWSIGVMMYFLLCGELPFHGEGKLDLVEQITNSNLTFRDQIWEEISGEAKHLISKLLNKNSAKRPSADEILRHGFFTKNFIKLKSMNSIDRGINFVPFDLKFYIFQNKFYNKVSCIFVDYLNDEILEKLKEEFNHLDTENLSHVKLSQFKEIVEKTVDSNLVNLKINSLLKEFEKNEFNVFYKQIFNLISRIKLDVIYEYAIDLFYFLDYSNEGKIQIEILRKIFIKNEKLSVKFEEAVKNSNSKTHSDFLDFSNFCIFFETLFKSKLD